MVKTCKGRRKIDMVKIQKECNRMVTYSKRRAGVFKKASELATLCGTEIAIIVFSPGGKAYSFGHPNVENVLDRYDTGEVPRKTSTQRLVEAHRSAVSQDLNMQLTEVLNELEKAKKYGQELDQIRSERQSQHWWESPIDTLNLSQLDQLKAALQQLKQQIQSQAEQIEFLSAAQALQTFPANDFVPDRNAAAFPPAPNAFPTAPNASAFPTAPNAFPPAPNASAFPTAPNASAFPTALNAFQRAALNFFPPAPNSNAAGAFESRPELNPRFPPSDQSAVGMINNEVAPFGHNSRFGNNGSF